MPPTPPEPSVPLRYTQTTDSLTARSAAFWAGWVGLFFTAFLIGLLGFALYTAAVAAQAGDRDGVQHQLVGILFGAVFFGWLPVFLLGRQTIRLSPVGLERRYRLFGLTLRRRTVPANRLRQIGTVYESGDEVGAVRLLVVTADGRQTWWVRAEDDEITDLAARLNAFRSGRGW